MKDPRKRLGGGPDDAESVRRHVFFKSIHWDDLLRKNIPAPFVPKVKRVSSDQGGAISQNYCPLVSDLI